MKEQINHEALKRYLNGKYSLKDFNTISQWFESTENDDELINAVRDHWGELSKTEISGKDLGLVLARIKQKMISEKPVINFRSRVQQWYMRIAVVLLVPLMLYSVYSTFFTNQLPENAWVEICSPDGARTQFSLPDGTEGWLNGGSRLKYATAFTNDRHVNLVGEAWFDVEHAKDKPFVVSTESFDIQVLGTKFNVMAFPDEKTTEVVLQEGKVKINGGNKQILAEMKPDEKFAFDKELRRGTIQKVNAEQLTAWKDGLLIFRNEPLADALKRISQWYKVDLVLTDPDLAKFRYRATFHEEPIEEVVRLISLTVPIEYSFDDRQIGDNGVFKKRTITIRRKRI